MPQQHSARVGGSIMIGTGAIAIILIGSMAAFTKAQAPKPPVLLDQGWSAEDRAAYHRSSQGSAVMPYQLFLALEQAEGTEPFRADSVSDRFGLLTEPADPRTNPDGLPIGLVKTSVPAGRWKGDWIGLSCSTCHCSELSYKGQKIRIEGGSNHAFDFAGYISALDQALAATQRDPAKFDRVATRMKANGDGARAELRAQLDEAAEVVHTYISRDAAMATPSGPGRMDALTLIHTRVVDGALGVPENWEAALAPAKPPFLWNAPQSAWVQWSGTASDPFYRNATESMGVFTRMDLRSPSPEQGLFESTVDVRGQLKIEELLRRLAPPKWPEEVFGPIDRAKAARGRALFMEHCSACHSIYPHRWSVPKVDGKRFIENALVPDVYVGTDPQQFKTPGFNRQPEYLTGNMASWMSPPFKGAELAPSLAVLSTARKGVLERALSSAALTPAELVDAHGYRYDWEKPPTQASYKAGPRDGVWATAPFLHNGSVPSLYDLLTPAKERPKTFLVGRDFDPVKVGVDTSGNSGRFEFDTTRIGNSNAGHSFENGPRGAGVIGRLLSEQERWDLVEFLKSIPTEAGQVTPYGGPKDPVEAWSDVHFFNNAQPTSYPVPAPSMELGAERVLPGEGELIQQFVDQTMARMRIQYPEGSEVRRDAHPKTHGMVKARFEVLDGLPAEFRHGLFATPKSYDAMVRFSASGTEISADTVQQAHGMAIKVLGVEGPKALEDERDATTQDFVMINYPTFLSRNVADYEAFHAARIGGLAQTEIFLKMNPPVLRAIEGLNGAPFWNPLQSRYWSQTPYRLGAGAMKFSARPVVAPVKPAAIQKGPDYLRQAMVTQIGADEVVFEFLVQLQKDPVSMPVEDALVEWMESESPFVRVAMLRIPKQDLSSGEDLRIAENLSFTPWHALEVQRPLGGINRARKVAYEAISKYRHERNGVPRVEP